MTPLRFILLFAGLASTVLGQQTITVNIPANQAWTNTGIHLNAGDTVRIDARGEIEAVPPTDMRAQFHRVPPSGRPERQSNKPQPDMPTLVLLARIGDGPVLEAGAHAQFQAGGQNGTGELLLGINDDFVADNTGSWTAQVTVNNAGSGRAQQRNDGRYQTNPNRNDRYQNRGDRNEGVQTDPPYRGNRAGAASALDSKARQLGREVLGAPLGDVQTAADGIGRYRQYRNGAIYWSPDTGAHALLGPIYDEWLDRGAESGEIGYPTSDETLARDGRSRIMRFQGGTITWNERSGVRVDRR
ncbi:MAG TPA: hypothetical protein VMZ52_15190 [Bryobacteraceae bacterium]|nr:hypothetical protein [Bryobacteraceae bacterium]